MIISRSFLVLCKPIQRSVRPFKCAWTVDMHVLVLAVVFGAA
jgi:hypothetical protein